MAKTTNLATLGRMGTIEPVTVRDHSKLRSASIEASNQLSSNSLGYSFFADQELLPTTASSRRQQLAIAANRSSRSQQQHQQHRNAEDSPEGGQYSPDYLSSGSSSTGISSTAAAAAAAGAPGRALETPCALKPSASTSCLLTTEESNSSNTLVCIPTRASLTHEWKRLKTPNKCRECNLLVYFNGRECSFCGFVAHKKCVTVLVIKCSGQQVCGSTKCSKKKQQELQAARQQAAVARGKGGAAGKPVAQPIFGQPINDNGPKVVDFVKRFIYEIDTRGLTSRGIYRVSSIKSKVDRLCNYYDQNISSLVDLSSFHPNIIANALKMYLRQLPEPLLTQQLYTDFIEVAKRYPKSKTNQPTDSSSTSTTKQSQQSLVSSHKLAKRSLVATQLEAPSRRDYDPMLIVELSEIIELLPTVNLKVIALLMRHLKRVADMSDENQMSATNLSIIFGPTLLSADNNKSLAIVDNIHQARAIELLISWADKIFPQFDNYESKAVIELDFSELEEEQRREREREKEQQALILLKAHEKEAKKRGQSKCNCPHHINSRDHDQQADETTNTNENDKSSQQQQQQDQWPKTRTELMELRRQFFTLPTTATDNTTTTTTNKQPEERLVIPPTKNVDKSTTTTTSTNRSNSRNPSLPMIKVQSHDTTTSNNNNNENSGLRLFRR